MKKISYKTKILLALSYFLYRITLDYLYVYAISPFFDYQYMEFNFNSILYLLSYVWCLFIFLFDLELFQSNRPSAYILWFTDLLFFIPLSSIIPLAGMMVSFFFYSLFFWILMAIFYLRLPKYSKNDDYDRCYIPKTIVYISTFVIVVNLFFTIYYNGFTIKFDLADVYDIRQDVRDMHLPTFIGYLKPLASLLGLILLCVFIIQRRIVWVIILTVIQLMNFAFGALKGDLLILIMVYAIGFFYRPRLKKYIPLVFVLMNLIAILEFKIQGVSLFCFFIQRRLMFVPPLLSFKYFEFFLVHEPVYLRDSIMRYIGLSSPYPLEIPRLIGDELFNESEMNANTGILGDDFAQFKWFALFIYPFFRVKLMQLLDYSAKRVDSRLLIFLGFSFSISFISGSLFSILLTGGFLAVCLLFYYWTKLMEDKYKKTTK